MADKDESPSTEPIKTDTVPPLSHDQPSNQEISTAATSKPESQGDKFSHHIKQYPNDELKLYPEEESKIGVGGFGNVRKYHHKDKTVAVKEFAIKAEVEKIKNIWGMVRREANILCRFEHENIVKIIGITQWPNVVGIILEYIDGGNLRSLLSTGVHSELSWNARLEIARGITSGLDYIHNYGEKKTFCHGDLKPENVLLTKKQQVKLADFGSAAFYRATAATTTTINNVSSGQFTLVYVAPEFLLDTTLAKKPPMDMYSFGMVLFELISGQEPYADCGMPTHVPALIVAKQKPSGKCIDLAEKQLKSDDDRAAFRVLKKLMEKCWNNDPKLRLKSKTVTMALNAFLMKQRQSLTLPNPGIEIVGVNTAARERNIVTAPTVVALEKPGTTSTSSTSVSQSSFKEDQLSVTSSSPKQSSHENAMLTTIPTMPGIFSTNQSSSTQRTLEEFSSAPGPSTLLGDNMSVSDILEAYAKSLLEMNFKQAENHMTKLHSMLVNDFSATAEEVRRFGEKLQTEEKLLQSVAVFDTAAALFAKLMKPAEDLERIQFCIQGMTKANEGMIKKGGSIKVIIKEHVLPHMRKWLHVMKDVTYVAEKWHCHAVCWALSNIETCELLVDQRKERKQSLEEAVSRMRKVFGRGVYKLHGRLFGNLLNHLGDVYNSESRYDDANDLFTEAIKANKEGEDYFGDEKSRAKHVSISENNLQSNMQKAWAKKLQSM